LRFRFVPLSLLRYEVIFKRNPAGNTGKRMPQK
jgi:hypothetical protein